MQKLFLALLLLTACQKPLPPPLPPSALPVQIAKPLRQDVTRRINTVASLEPWQATTVYAQTSGYVREIHIDRGDAVRAGQLLVLLDLAELPAEQTRLKAQMLEARAGVQQAQVLINTSEIDVRRLHLVQKEEPGAVALQTLTDAEQRLAAAKAAAATASTRLGVLQADVERLAVQAKLAHVIAPFDGTISDRLVDLGTLVAAGTASKPTAIARIVDASRLRALVDVPERDVVQAVIGRDVQLIVEAYPGKLFHGLIARRSEALDPASRTMRIEVEIDNSDKRLRSGMSARVKLDLETRPQVLAVAARWLKMAKDQPYVFVVREGVARRIDVKTGADDGRFIEIISGLSGSEPIIANAPGSVSDGTAVQIAGEVSETGSP